MVLILAASCALTGFPAAPRAAAQAVTIDSSGRVADPDHPASIDRRFAQITPTSVELSKSPMDPKNKLEVIRIMQSEQGFAMRPFPKGHKGLTLVANGKLLTQPAGKEWDFASLDAQLKPLLAGALAAHPRS